MLFSLNKKIFQKFKIDLTIKKLYAIKAMFC